jgi:hypothetical protein
VIIDGDMNHKNLKQSEFDTDKGDLQPEEVKDVYDSLCSLMTTAPGCAAGNLDSRQCPSPACSSDQTCYDSRADCFKTCPKQLQLPMFLSSKFLYGASDNGL